MVLWKGRWYPARVLAASGGRWFIKYDGFSARWNEWVRRSRIRPYGYVRPRPRPHYGYYAPGQRVHVLWRGRWYPARVLYVNGNRYRIRYIGYGSNWDQWVGPSRIRR